MNYRIRGGETDIIAPDQEFLVFVEVKTRSSYDFGLPAESITAWKIGYLLKAAQFYIQQTKWGDKPDRIEALLVDYTNSKDKLAIELLKNITM